MDEDHYGHVSPEEPRLGPDGAVYVQTLSCGIERITAVDRKSQSRRVYYVPRLYCGVPTIVGHYLIQSVPLTHGLIVVDIANGRKPVEVSRLKLSDYFLHTGRMGRKDAAVVVTGSGAAPLLAETGPVDRSPHPRRCLS